MNPTLQGYLAAVLDSVDADRLGAVASDLNDIEQLVLGTPALRAALSDTAVNGSARTAVMRDLLEGRVSEPARRLASFASGAVPAPDVIAALGWVAHRAQRDAEGVREPERRFCLGVQWHPEYLLSDGDRRLFAAFIAACGA